MMKLINKPTYIKKLLAGGYMSNFYDPTYNMVDALSVNHGKSAGSNSQYAPSEDILQFILGYESFKPNWYLDGNGNWTIGYGFKESKFINRRNTRSLSLKQADKIFRTHFVPQVTKDLMSATPNFDKLNQNQRDALFSYMYNFGVGNYRNSPKMQKALRDLNHPEVVRQMDAGYNDPRNRGLRARRDAERAWYNGNTNYKRR